MNIKAIGVKINSKLSGERLITVYLSNGAELTFAASSFPRLKNATTSQLSNVQIQVNGRALRWEEIDEDISIDALISDQANFPLTG